MLEALTESDGTLWSTLRKLLRNPGRVALNYINGTRSSYLNPIRFFLVSFTIYLGLMILSGAQLDIASRAYQPVIAGNADVDTSVIAAAVTETIASRMNLVIILVIPVLVFFVRWLFWWKNRNYAETFTFVCFVLGLGYLYGAATIPIEYLLNTFSSIPKNLITMMLFMIGARTFFSVGWFAAIGGAIVSAVLYLFTMTSVTALISFGVIFAEGL